MRIVYIDIDTLRPDRLGCYGYHRNTSPSIDRVAADGIRYNQGYVSEGSGREQLLSSASKEDPSVKIIEEGGPFHTRGMLPEFVRHFQKIEKPEIAERMLKRYGKNPAYNP